MLKISLIVFSAIGLSLAALDVPAHLRSPLKHARKACMAESNVDEKYIEQSKNGYLPDNPELGCYISCLLEHFGMFDPDGSIVWERVLHLLPPSNKETALFVNAECKTVFGNNKCETALLTFKCYFEKAPEDSEIP